MRASLLGCAATLLAACATSAPVVRVEAPPPTPAALPAAAPPVPLSADTPSTTVEGATFIAPAGWTVTVKGPATVVQAPEPGSRLALVDVRAPDADAAVAAAWAAYRPDHAWPLLVASPAPDKDGWSDIKAYSYQTSPNEKRTVVAVARRAGEVWTVALLDMEDAVLEKRGAAVSLVLGRLLPRGFALESFAGKKAHPLDAPRLAALSAWVEKAMKALGIPGVAVGLVQDGKVVFADGYGVKELGKPGKPDADTLFMIASNTKALTTLMLATLVAEKRLAWDTQVTSVLPTFKLADPDITRQVEVKHLICACTGLPRQDLEWLFQFKGVTAAGAMATLATVQPTSKFGEMFQYSNLLAGAGGFVGGHVLYPRLELGAAYDRAMQERVFDPLGMKATTFDYARALRGNHAFPHGLDVDGATARAVMELNYSIIPLRPAGAAWSSVRDLLRYVSMELAEGALPGGKRYLPREVLLERRVPQVSIGKDNTYGMGLVVSSRHGTPVVHHGGDMVGFHSDMLWLPEHGVGAVVLTNGDLGPVLRNLYQRKLLEVLFDGRPEADEAVEAQAKAIRQELAALRKLLAVPAEPAEAAKLAPHYSNPALGDIDVTVKGGITTFDFGEWKSPMASKRNPDGSVSFLTIAPGASELEFVVGPGPTPTLTTRDAQHEYAFTAK